MAEPDAKLVELIAEQVLAALRAGGVQRADVRPPIGQCTGDYSKFPELAGRLYNAPSSSQATGDTAARADGRASAAAVLSGIVTANQLQAAIDAAGDGVAVLAADARLSPLAADFAREHPRKVRRVGTDSAAASSASPAANATLPWMWWIDGSCPVVAQVTGERGSQLTRAVSLGSGSAALGQVVRDLASAIKSHRVLGGLLFVHNAARAMCLANRCQSIRAVVGTCGEAVEQGIAELGANVLVIEYPHHGPRAVAAMVDRFMQQPPRVPPAVERELAELHRCG